MLIVRGVPYASYLGNPNHVVRLVCSLHLICVLEGAPRLFFLVVN